MNYLRQLAARTLNQLPVVQPRLPARFEAARRESLDDGAAPIEHATFTPGAPSIVAGVAAFAPGTIVPETPCSIAVDQFAPRETPAAPRPSLEPAPVSPMLAYQTESRRAAETDRVAPTPPTTAIEHNTVTRVIERETETIVSNNTLIDHTTPIEQRTPIERERVLAPTTIMPADTHPPRVAPQVTAYVPPAPERVSLPEAAPVIHVSIGRIEVRAVQPPTPASGTPRAAPKPALSLDDYMHGVRT